MAGAPADHSREDGLPDALRADRRLFSHHDIYDAADWYDVDYAAYRAELTFYRLLLGRHARGRAVVEVGAGTGRLTLPLHASGFFIHAVEPAAAMRQLLQQKLRDAHIGEDGVTVEDALADTFVGPDAPVGLVIFAFNGLLHLRTRAELAAAFRHIHGRLAGDGVIALDVTPPYWETLLRGQVGWGRVDERVHPRSGRRFLTCDRSRYEAASRTAVIDIRYAYLEGDEDGVEITLRQTMWTTPEILQALDDEGFVVDASFGDVDLAGFDEGSPRLLVSARRR